jgi:hypothetical protein
VFLLDKVFFILKVTIISVDSLNPIYYKGWKTIFPRMYYDNLSFIIHLSKIMWPSDSNAADFGFYKEFTSFNYDYFDLFRYSLHASDIYFCCFPKNQNQSLTLITDLFYYY